MSRDHSFTPDVIIFMLDYDGCTAIDPNTGLPCTDNVMEEMVTLLTRYPCANIILKIGSYRQTIWLNYGNWARNNNGCCFAALEDLQETFCEQYPEFSDRVEIDPFILEDLFRKTAHGAHFRIGRDLKTLENTARFFQGSGAVCDIAWHDETKIAELYAHMQQSSMQHRQKKILFYYFDDRDDIHDALAMAFQYHQPHWVPRDLVMRRVKCANGIITRRHFDIIGVGCVHENFSDTTIIVYDLFLLHSIQNRVTTECALRSVISVRGWIWTIEYIAEVKDLAHQGRLLTALIVIAGTQQNQSALEYIANYCKTHSHYIGVLFGLAEQMQFSIAQKILDEKPEFTDSDKKIILQLLEKYSEFKGKYISHHAIGKLLAITREHYDTPSKKYSELHQFYLQIAALNREKLDLDAIKTLKVILTPLPNQQQNGILLISSVLDEMISIMLNDTASMTEEYHWIKFTDYIEGYRHYQAYKKIMYGITRDEQATASDVHQFLAERFGHDLTDLSQHFPIRIQPESQTALKKILTAIDKQKSQNFYENDSASHAAFRALRLVIAKTRIEDATLFQDAIAYWKNAPSLLPGKTNNDVLVEADKKIIRKSIMLFPPRSARFFISELPYLIAREQKAEKSIAQDATKKSVCAMQ